MKTNRMLILSVTLILAMGALAACAKSPAPTTAPNYVPPANTSAPAESTKPAGSTNMIDISGFAFSPSTLTVKVGTTVTWTNKDSVDHTITSDTNVFDSGNMGSGDTFSYTFTTAGTFVYHCTVHPSMIGTIIVTQ